MKKRIFLILIAFIFTLVLTSCHKKSIKEQVLNPDKNIICFIYDVNGKEEQIYPSDLIKISKNKVSYNQNGYYVLDNGDLIRILDYYNYGWETGVHIETYYHLLAVITQKNVDDNPRGNPKSKRSISSFFLLS